MLVNTLNILEQPEANIIAEADAVLGPADDSLVQVLEDALNLLLENLRLVDGHKQIILVGEEHVFDK